MQDFHSYNKLGADRHTILPAIRKNRNQSPFNFHSINNSSLLPNIATKNGQHQKRNQQTSLNKRLDAQKLKNRQYTEQESDRILKQCFEQSPIAFLNNAETEDIIESVGAMKRNMAHRKIRNKNIITKMIMARQKKEKNKSLSTLKPSSRLHSFKVIESKFNFQTPKSKQDKFIYQSQSNKKQKNSIRDLSFQENRQNRLISQPCEDIQNKHSNSRHKSQKDALFGEIQSILTSPNNRLKTEVCLMDTKNIRNCIERLERKYAKLYKKYDTEMLTHFNDSSIEPTKSQDGKQSSIIQIQLPNESNLIYRSRVALNKNGLEVKQSSFTAELDKVSKCANQNQKYLEAYIENRKTLLEIEMERKLQQMLRQG